MPLDAQPKLGNVTFQFYKLSAVSPVHHHLMFLLRSSCSRFPGTGASRVRHMNLIGSSLLMRASMASDFLRSVCTYSCSAVAWTHTSVTLSVFVAVGAVQWSEDVVPTVAFHFRKVRRGNVTLKIWDLAGAFYCLLILGPCPT